MKVISFKVHEVEYRAFKALAANGGRSVAELLREAMTDYLRHRRPVGRRLAEIQPRKGRQIAEGWSRSEVFCEMIDRGVVDPLS